MAAFDGSMKAIVSADITNYQKNMNTVAGTASSVSGKVNGSFAGMSTGADGATKSTGFLGSKIGQIAAGVGAVALVSKGIDVLKSSVSGAVARFDTLNAYPKVMKQMGYSTEDVNKSVSVLKKGVDGLPTSLQDLTKSAQSFAILTGSATKGAQAASAMNDAFIASGASAATAEQGTQDYSKMLAEGKVNMQDWNSVAGDMPLAMKQVANSFGLTGKSAVKELYNKLKAGDITMEQLNDRFIQLDGGAKGFAATARAASGGIGTSFTNMKNAVTNGLADTITAIDNGLKNAGITNGIAGLFNQAKGIIVSSFATINSVVQTAIPPIISIIKGLFDFVQQNSDWLGPLTVGIAAGITAFKTVTSAIKLYQGAIKIATGIQTAFNTVMAMNPFTLIIVAITAVVAALVWFFTQTKTGKKVWQDFTSWLTGVWQAIPGFFSGIWQGIVNIFNTTVSAIANFLSSGIGQWVLLITMPFLGIVNFIVQNWNTIQSVTMSVWNAITSFIGGVWNNIVSFVTNGINTALSVIQSIMNSIASVWSSVWNVIKSVANAIWNSIKSVVSAGISAVKSVVSAGVNAVMSVWNGITRLVSIAASAFGKVVSTVSGGINRAVSAVKNAVSGMLSAGSNFVMGFVKGITGAIGNAVSAAASMAKKALNAAKSALGIHSPSREMATVGMFTVLGMAKGIDNNSGHVEKAMSSLASGVISTGQSAVNTFQSSLNNLSVGNALKGISDFQSKIQNQGLVAQTSFAGGDMSTSSELSQDVLNAPSTTVNVTVEQNWDGDKVYYAIKNKDARNRARINVIKK